ncbi:MAG TPA: patatin-like phospholipase family protein [Candidatus Acidoferrum sp.]|nr:patatin-like phospholipase family protein [Candidatus Acidoferrum sp.]
MKSIKVLAIDGGGIRGIIPALILSEIQKRLAADLYTFFDLISGTSTGGIIALGIGTQSNKNQPYSPTELADLYVENGPAIFKKNLITPITNLGRPKYSPDALQSTLVEFFGDTQFNTALTPLLVSSYDLRGQVPFFFKSHRIAENSNYNWPVVSIARATSAAPTYFPPLQLIRGSDNYALVDGGVFVNNPAMAAYAEARALYPDAAQFIVVSVGTGNRQDQITYATAKNWGLLQWARQIAPVFMDSVSEAVDYELRSMPGCTYYRLQVENLDPASPDMDNVTPQNLTNLQAVAANYLRFASKQIDAICAALAEGRGSDMPGIGLPTLTHA